VSDAFALAAHAAFQAADAAFFGAFEATVTVGVQPPAAARVFVDEASEGVGDFGEVVVGQQLVTFIDAGRALAQPAAIVALPGGRVLELERKVFDDGVTARWSARRV
jgi:hypothetical protein